MIAFLRSLKTTVWTLAALVCVLFAGSALMPLHREVFGPMNDRILLDWSRGIGIGNLGTTWWFFAAVLGLLLLTANTLVCSIQAVIGTWSRRDFLLRLAPQVVHAGFLCILLAHAIGAAGGYRIEGSMPEGAFSRIPEGRAIYLKEVRVIADERGYLKDWAAEVYLFEGSRRVAAGVLGPNRPLFYQGAGIYLKSFELQPWPSAQLLIARDPGALWALAGGVLFLIGTVVVLALKRKGPGRAGTDAAGAASGTETV